jgi:hypothetical protein
MPKKSPLMTIKIDKLINSLIGSWSLLDEKEYFYHLILFSADGSFNSFRGLPSENELFKATWNYKGDSPLLQFTEPDEVKISCLFTPQNVDNAKLNPHKYYSIKHLHYNSFHLNRERME